MIACRIILIVLFLFGILLGCNKRVSENIFRYIVSVRGLRTILEIDIPFYLCAITFILFVCTL